MVQYVSRKNLYGGGVRDPLKKTLQLYYAGAWV